jgi:hypothetical protein
MCVSRTRNDPRSAAFYAGMMLVWEDAYMRLEVDRERKLARQTRSARSYDDVPTLLISLRALIEHMSSIPRAEYALLQDMRAPRGRNDPAFEQAITRERSGISGGFRKLAVVVTTQVGRLHVQRHLQHAPQPARAFLDEQTALRWLLEP